MAIVLTIKSFSKKDLSRKPPIRVSVESIEGMTVGELKTKYLSQIKSKLDLNRVRFVIEGSNQALAPNEKALSSFGISSDSTIIFKDLGPQISWKTVFIVEYLFPTIVFPVLWLLVRKFPSSFLTRLIYPTEIANPSTLVWQDLLSLMFTLHFAKREFETFFVHRFGNDTMPITNIFKNSIYYWLFALWIAFVTLHPLYTAPTNQNQRVLGVLIFGISEILNFKTHMDLRNLRPSGTRVRRVPQGVLFSLVSCPNYLFEILAWIGFTIASQSVAAAAFTCVGAAQMIPWAIQKHKRYRKEFDGKEGRELYPAGRRILLPFLF